MPLIRNGRRTDDIWTSVADDDPLPHGPAIVSLPRWQVERATLIQRNSPLGVRLAGGDPPEAVAADLSRLDLIQLEFSAFTDGRPYSTARVLRHRLGFTGEIRAVGQVLRDQILFMLRCGFDGFAIANERDADGWCDAIDEFGVVYQPAADRRVPAWALRHPATIR